MGLMKRQIGVNECLQTCHSPYSTCNVQSTLVFFSESSGESPKLLIGAQEGGQDSDLSFWAVSGWGSVYLTSFRAHAHEPLCFHSQMWEVPNHRCHLVCVSLGLYDLQLLALFFLLKWD